MKTEVQSNLVVMTGKEFKEKYNNEEFYKLTNKFNNDNNFQYRTGNYNIVQYHNKPTINSTLKGLSFSMSSKMVSSLYDLKKSDSSGLQKIYHIRRVTIPDDAWVSYEDHEKMVDLRSTKIVLDDEIPIIIG